MIEEIKQRLAQEVEQLNHELNVVLPEVLKKAIRQGDLRENGDYQAALERQQFVQARLSQLRARLSKLSQINLAKVPKDRVGLGSRVVVEDLETGERITYELVIPDAMDFDAGQISVASPLGRALLDRKAGDQVTVRLPEVTRKLKIVELETLHDQAVKDLR
ncbi:MAG: transcription elongation factor GreA [Gemmatimonadales bacterium]|nr:Transcription elongation factor GreA [bacterium HR33]GIW52470.1 MAG: transcription elongation factor GreA [Gemmatimonadales bacterium]